MGRIAASILLFSLVSLTHANTLPEIRNTVERVCENVPQGNFAFQINATDADNDVLTYKIETTQDGRYFTADQNTGTVTVKEKLDRETLALMRITVTVADPHQSNSKEIPIIILDANDNRPEFGSFTYERTVPEDAPNGASLFTVKATDKDTAIASFVKYHIDEVTPNSGFSLFSIRDTTGEVTLNGQLNYNALGPLYRLKINASDGGGAAPCDSPLNVQSSIAYAFVTVVDLPDLDPKFLGPYSGEVEEGSRVGTSVITVTAEDQDKGIDDTIIYSIENSTVPGLFDIGRHDGVISVKSDIDREVVGGAVTLIVKATEANLNIHGQEASATAHVDITIKDINDNKPEFYRCGGTDENKCEPMNTFTGEIPEHSRGFIELNMTVRDLDERGRIQLMLEGPDKDVFSVDPPSAISEAQVQLMVKDSQKLDFEEKEVMVVQVIAEDRDNTSLRSTATVTINIKDVNDNSPKFTNDIYKLEVDEHSAVNTIFAEITAVDVDTMDQGKITYALFPDSILSYFDVRPTTGEIYVKNSSLIDREVRSLYSATLQARDTSNNTGTAVLEITLIDINDNSPVFYRGEYVAFVEEGRQLELPIEAIDGDDTETDNSKIVYGIMPSDYSANFTINPDTGVLTNNGELDREALDPDLNGEIVLIAIATDKGTPPRTSNVTVTIDLIDVNDNAPVFKAASYKFSVKEGERGAFVGSVQAEDLDQTSSFNRISFSIIDGSVASFTVASYEAEVGYMGNISVDQGVELDYEGDRKSFTLRVEAADREQKTATVMVEVEVLDVNDERPVFLPSNPVTVKENTTIDGALGKFSAEDRDGNHSLVYELESVRCQCSGTWEPCSWFLVEPTGEVILNPEHTVDYELCDQAEVKAQVVDKYTEKGENNSVTSGVMVIKIEDINDNAPEFIPSNVVNVVVSESANTGTSVARVTATDRDSGVNKEITFKVTGVKFQNNENQTNPLRDIFEAITAQQKDFYEGTIQSTEELKTDLKGKYLVTVVATDSGGLSTSTELEIFTVDISYKIELRFTSPVYEVLSNKDNIIKALRAATGTDVRVSDIKSASTETRNDGDTIMEAYFVYFNGTALTSSAVEKMLSDPIHYSVLNQYGLIYIGDVPVEEPKQDPIMFVLLGLLGGFILVLVVLTISLVCTRRNYRTKLKAAKAMNFASMVTTENQHGGPVVPGTNKYTMEGANPVLNLNIDTAIDLGFDEESSNTDKISLSSLDDNVDMMMSEKDSRPMTIIQEEDEDDGDPEYIEPLGAALAQRDKKKDPVNQGYDNPAFSTTDL